MKYKVLIIDDEPLAQDVLETFVTRMEEFEIVAKSGNAVEAFQILKNEKIDILFLDIQMPEVNGLELLKMIKNPPAVILTTAYSEYALQSYEFEVVDYLLKPIAFDRFLKAVNKAIDRISLKTKKVESTTVVKAPVNDFFFIKSEGKTVKVKYNDILYIESIKNYIKIKTTTKEIVSLCPIGKIYDMLPRGKFIRAHRSYIVSVNKVEAYSQAYVEVAKIKIPIGGIYKDAINDFFAKYDVVND